MQQLRLVILFCTILTACAAKLGDGAHPCATGTVLDPATMACVQCLPGAADNCPSGQYCAADNTCVAGCATDSDCGNTSCCDHKCVDTTSDPQSCGTCGHACGQGDSCCGGSCTGTTTLTDCGACGNTCAAGDFCDGTKCNTPTYPNFCANKNVYVIYDGIAPDNHAADVMASTITANCPQGVIVQTGLQTNPALVDQATGAPLAGSGVTYVLGGGPFPNAPLKWLERTNKTTKIFFDAPDGINFYWKLRTDNTAVAMMPGSSCSAHRDQFITELVTDPNSGTLSLIGYGACSGGKGTLAAAWHYANVLLPNKMNYPDSWYVFSWSDTNNNSTPDAGDAFTVLAHGL